MKVLYSHHGMKGKNGWGRTFYMAQGLADLGHDVTLLTINPKCSFFKICLLYTSDAADEL